jgi:hypothetical protein
MDLAVVSGHVLLPDDLTASLPAIDQGWGNFGVGDATGPVPEWDNPERFFANVGADRRNEVARFLEGVDHPLANNEFHFAHLLLPHRPWSYLPDGREYLATGLTGRGPGGWGADAWLVEQSYQRLQIQVQYVDRLLGDLIDRLESHDSYDHTLIVIVADHGISVRPEQPRRSIRPETIGDIAAVPLFIKRPHQDSGGVDDYRAETTDVVPTIADVLGIDLPWRADGVSLFSEDRPPRTQSTMMSGHPVTFGVDGNEKQTIADYHLEYFGDRGPFGLAPIGQADLLGTDLASLDFDDDPESQLLLDLPEGYLATDPGADPLPAQISGRVSGGGDGYLTLAIVLNGRIEAVTRSGAFGDSERFVAMLPPDALRAENQVEVLVVQGSGATRTLTRPTGS